MPTRLAPYGRLLATRTFIGFGLVVAGLGVGWPHAGPALQAQAPPAPLIPVVGRAVGFAETRPLGELAAEEARRQAPAAIESRGLYVVPNKLLPASLNQDFTQPAAIDPVLVGPAPLGAIPAPSLTFPGTDNNENQTAFGMRVIPPDTNGDVGPNHYVQTVNLLVRVWNKAGTPLTPPFKLSSLFAALGGPCATADSGDPIVLYDPLADRWLLSQLCLSVTLPFHQMIAISKTPDPTGPYWAWDFLMPNNKLNDYPHFGVWPDAYYMSDNQFDRNGLLFLGAGAFAFNRARILVGDPAANYIYFDTCPTGSGFECPVGGQLPSDLDGLVPPPPGSPNYFMHLMDPGLTNTPMRVFAFHADFASPGQSTFAQVPGTPLAVAPYDPRDPIGNADVEQPAPGTNLDAISDRLMHRLQYRNFGTHESFVVNHTVNISGMVPSVPGQHQTGVRYYEFRRTGGVFSVNQQATYSSGPVDPVNGLNYWMASAAMDRSGNLALGMSKSSPSVHPSVVYAARYASTPPGLFEGEETIIAGTGAQTSILSRWGDYSGLTVDPSDDCTFWYTSEYFKLADQGLANGGAWSTHIGKFSLGNPCTPQAPGHISGTVMNGTSGLPLVGAYVLIDGILHGGTGTGGTYSIPVAPGTRTVTVTAPFYSQDSAGGIVVAAGGTTVAPTLTIVYSAGTIEGTVTNGATGQRFAGAVMSIDGAFAGLTNASGQYSFLVYAGPHTVSATAPDYSTEWAGVLVSAGGTVVTNLALVTRAVTFTNAAPIAINPHTTASPYPATINVTGMKGTIRKVSVSLNALTCQSPNELDVLVVGPAGQALAIMSDVGSDPAVFGIDLKITDSAASILPESQTLTSGSYRPSNVGAGDSFPAPAPLTAYSNPAPAGSATLTSTFSGTSPNGLWRLFIVTDGFSCTGNTIAGGWSLTFEMSNAPADFDGDGITDWAVTRDGSLTWHVLNSVGYTGVAFGDDTEDIRVPGDYDGDGNADLAVWRPSTGTFRVLRSSDGSLLARQFGAIGDDPRIVGDYDGDGRDDFAVYRPGNPSVWWVLRSSDDTFYGTAFGQTGDKPAPGDYDGDRKADLAVARGPGAAIFYVMQSTAGFFAAQWGFVTDSIEPGDYDGDGKTDIAVARQVSGAWNHYVRRSSTGSLYGQVWGLATDVLTPGDYDGDAKSDFAVWRPIPAPSTFFALRSSNGALAAQPWGLNGDYPVLFFVVH